MRCDKVIIETSCCKSQYSCGWTPSSRTVKLTTPARVFGKGCDTCQSKQFIVPSGTSGPGLVRADRRHGRQLTPQMCMGVTLSSFVSRWQLPTAAAAATSAAAEPAEEEAAEEGEEEVPLQRPTDILACAGCLDTTTTASLPCTCAAPFRLPSDAAAWRVCAPWDARVLLTRAELDVLLLPAKRKGDYSAADYE